MTVADFMGALIGVPFDYFDTISVVVGVQCDEEREVTTRQVRIECGWGRWRVSTTGLGPFHDSSESGAEDDYEKFREAVERIGARVAKPLRLVPA